MLVIRQRVLVLFALVFGVAAVEAQTTEITLTLQPDGDARFFEYFSDAFAQLDRGFNGNPALDGFYLISAWEASGGTVYQQVGGGFDVFVVQNPCPGTGCTEDNWVDLGDLNYAGTGNGTFSVTGLDIEFNDVIPGNSLVLSKPYETEVTSVNGTVTVSGGQVTDINLTAAIKFILDGSNFGEPLVPYEGTLEIDNGRFFLDVDDSFDSATGPYRVVWDVAGDVVAGQPPQTGTLALSAASYSIDEDGGSLTVTVNRAGGSDGAAAVNYATANGTAVAPGDYQARSGTLNWTSGDANSKTFSVPIVDDATFEGNETFSIALSGASGASLGSPSSATVTIVDNDTAPIGSVRFLNISERVDEGQALVLAPVERVGGSAGAITVDYSTVDGTAIAPDDYTATTGTLQWADGEAGIRLAEVPLIDDTLIEGLEFFEIQLATPTGGASVDEPSVALIEIRDNEEQIFVDGFETVTD